MALNRSPMLWRRYSVCVAILGAFGCSESSDETKVDAEIALSPIVLRPGFYVAEGDVIQLLEDGDEVPVRLATQGGFAMFFGARATGLTPGGVDVRSELINPDNAALFLADSRNIQTVAVPDEGGAIEPDSTSTSNFSHLLPCPNYEERAIEGVDWILRFEMSDPANPAHKGEATVTIRPKCLPGPRYEQCVCECKPLYVFEKCGAPH